MEGEIKQNIDINEIIKQLNEVVNLHEADNEDKANDNIMKILDSFLDASRNSFEEHLKFTIDDIHIFITLLTHKSNIIVTKTAKTIAELARTKEGREKCSQNDLIKLLINLLKEDDIGSVTQACRALGNICYENEVGNKTMQENDGLNLILKVLKRSVNRTDEEGSAFLRYVAAGLLLNFLADQSAALQEEALKKDLISIICDILDIDGVTGGNSAMHALLALETLNDSGRQFLNERLAKILINILDSDVSTELSELCLVVLQGQAECGEIKILLAKIGVCELVLKLLEKLVSEGVDEESKGILEVACDFIVFILTKEESMNMLYDDGNGVVYKKLVQWLATNNCDEDLQITAVLAMGNFATSDAHCQQMMATGIHQYLLRLLNENNSSDGNIRLQHALLSAIRNLVISPTNKQIMLADGLIDIVFPMLKIQAYPVAFKLLGTLRIVIDGQDEAATSLGLRDDLIKRTVEWCSTDVHLGVQAEANRLIAWLVINSRNKEVIRNLIDHGAISHLVKMITVSQTLMQNEALMSLTIMTTMMLEQCENALTSSNVFAALETFVSNNTPYSELPIMENALTFVNTIIKSDTIKKNFKEKQLIFALKKCEKEKLWTDSMKEKLEILSNLLSD